MAYHLGVESVRGTVIGQMNRRYQFWTVPPKGETAQPITKFVFFENDADAEEWFKEQYPKHYRAGAEMRIWD